MKIEPQQAMQHDCRKMTQIADLDTSWKGQKCYDNYCTQGIITI